LSILSKKIPRGFSLIEIILALGVIAFAIVGIMGLFPVAMKSAQESQRETRATFIAQQIFSDLRTGTGTNRFIITGTNLGTNTINLSAGTNLFLAYDSAGAVLGTSAPSSFTNGVADAAFLANVSVNTNTGVPNLSQVQTTVEAPAAAASSNRSRYTFVTLMNY
jgi:uncharacterized protein (TIGR02598 family)